MARVLEGLNIAPGDPAWADGHDVVGEAFEQLLPTPSRRALGQFCTPLWAARPMAEWLLAESADLLLDPGCGSGSLLIGAAHARRQGSTRFLGLDVDPLAMDMACVTQRVRGIAHMTLRRADFLLDDIPERPQAIICNPPYTRQQDIHQRSRPGYTMGSRLGSAGPSAEYQGIVACVVLAPGAGDFRPRRPYRLPHASALAGYELRTRDQGPAVGARIRRGAHQLSGRGPGFRPRRDDGWGDTHPQGFVRGTPHARGTAQLHGDPRSRAAGRRPEQLRIGRSCSEAKTSGVDLRSLAPSARWPSVTWHTFVAESRPVAMLSSCSVSGVVSNSRFRRTPWSRALHLRGISRAAN